MNLITIFPLISAIVVFFLGIAIFIRGKRNKLNITFAFFSLFSAIWMFGTFMMFFNEGDSEKIIFWDKFVYVGVIFIPVAMLHFGLALTKFKIIKNNFLVIVGYLFSGFFLALLPTDLFIDGAFIYRWGAHSKAQFFHHFFLIYFAIYILIWFIIVFKYFKQQTNLIEKERIKYCFVAFFILATIGPLAYLPAYGIGIYPFAYISGLIFTIIIFYAIVRYRFMDIKLVIRQSSVYIISLSVIFGLASVVKIIASKYLGEFIFWTDLMAIFFAAATFPYVKERFFKVANKYFFTSLYDSGKLILKTSNGLKTVLNIDKVYEFLYSTFSKNLHTKAFGVLARNDENKNYKLLYNKGFNIRKRKTFAENLVMENNFIKKNQIVIVEEFKSLHYNDKTKDLIELLASLEIELLIPLKVKNDLIGLLVFGSKETGEAYNDEDLQVLEIIAGQAAIAIENAQLYSEAKDFNVRLRKEVRQATGEVEKANTDLTAMNRKLSAAYKRLKQLDSAKNEFISIASHQLRTPLTSIKGYISLIRDGDYGRIGKEVDTALKKIFISNERLIKLVNDLLSLSRIEFGKFTFAFRNNDIADMVEGIVEGFNLEAENKNLKIKYIKPTKKIHSFVFDKSKMHEVISNLIDNAIKYTPTGGIEVQVKESGSKIRIIISDTGKGMGKEEVEYIFDKFRRGEGSSSLNTEGTGLGLYVCKKIVDAHKGKVFAISDGVGKGSQFIVELKKDFKPQLLK